ncbi:MAG: GIY-YIG nuclease family protein [Senegalia sp. (in: firmicutes)]|uniref:GIY-YIG nuclease family protein n=1 Tax=Senegalia sp. (in: firmicutes) TaxID=1924098 RepID=UPI003F977111
MSGKLIRLFLVNGNPNGLRTIEVSNMTIYATIFPRTKLKEFLNRNEAKKPGTYILMGESIEDTEKPKAYIGEGDPVEFRLKSHSSGKNQKDFWNQAIVFTSKDDYITKTQIQYLESEIYRLACETDKAKLENGQKPSKPNLSEVDNAEMEQFLDGVKLILSSLGIEILESQKTEEKEEEKKEKIFVFTMKEAYARMKIEEDKYIVLKGSTAAYENRGSILEPIKKKKEELIKKGILIAINTGNQNKYRFTEDYIFNSPSYAAAIVAGGTENGRVQWKYNGKSLNDLEAEEVKKK